MDLLPLPQLREGTAVGVTGKEATALREGRHFSLSNEGVVDHRENKPGLLKL